MTMGKNMTPVISKGENYEDNHLMFQLLAARLEFNTFEQVPQKTICKDVKLYVLGTSSSPKTRFLTPH